MWIELKTSPFRRDVGSSPRALAERVVEVVAGAGLIDRAVLLAFEWDVLGFVAGLGTGVQLDYLSLDPVHVIALHRKQGRIDPYALFGAFDPRRHGSVWAAIAAAGGHWWGPNVADVCADDVTQAQRLGLRVNVWNVGATDAELRAALALGADAITLSDPDRLLDARTPYLRT